jgi:hypothetical protein
LLHPDYGESEILPQSGVEADKIVEAVLNIKIQDVPNELK